MGWPTTLVLLTVLGCTTVLGYADKMAPEVIGSTFGAVVSGVLVGHYVKTSNGSTTTTTTPSGAETVTTRTAPKGGL